MLFCHHIVLIGPLLPVGGLRWAIIFKISKRNSFHINCNPNFFGELIFNRTASLGKRRLSEVLCWP